MEDYEKKYKEALERAKKYKEYDFRLMNAALDDIFPELRESEDEKIRKELIEFIDINTISTDERHDRWIAWLEKQGYVNALIQEASEKSYTEGMRTERKRWLEKQGEKLPTWSEEDERIITGISMVLQSWDSYHVSSAGLPSLIPQYVSWLKSLKQRLKGE